MSSKHILDSWWNRFVGSTAVAVGGAMFIGHEALQKELHERFGYRVTPLSIYSYDAVLMEGIDIFFRYYGPRLLASLCLALLIERYLPLRRRRIAVVVLLVPIALLMGAAMTRFAVDAYDLAQALDPPFVTLCFTALVVLALDLRERRLAPFATPAAMTAALVVSTIFMVWISSSLVPRGFRCFPMATLKLKEGGSRDYVYVTERDSLAIVGDTSIGRMVFLPMDAIANIELHPCE